MLPGVPISYARLDAFRAAYKEVYGEEIAVGEAREMAHRLIALYRLIMRPLPGETSIASPSPPPRAQSAPGEL